MHNQNPKNHGFTLTELMIVVVIIGLIALFGIPNYKKAMARSREKDANINLEAIREAVRLYISREAGIPPSLADVDRINSVLHVNVIAQSGNAYNCTTTNWYTCNATNSDGWQLRFQLDTNDGEIFCSAGSCPTIP